MAADFNKPVTTDAYTAVLAEVRDNDAALAVGLDPAVVTPANTPTNAIRWTSASNKWQKFNGTTWDDLSTLYAINISGNAATATTAAACSGNSASATNATNATHLNGGDAGKIPWQSAAGVTAYAAVGTAGYVLTSGGAGAPAWVEKVPIANGGTGADTAAAALAALGGAALAGASFTGGINEKRDTLAMHATTMDLWAKPNIVEGTGSAVTMTDIADAPQAGASRSLYPIAGTIITNGATFDVDGGGDATAAAGDRWDIEAITTTTFKVRVVKDDGINVSPAAVSDMANGSTGYFAVPVGTQEERGNPWISGGLRINTSTAMLEVCYNTEWYAATAAMASTTSRQGIFGYGFNGSNVSMTNKVSITGVVAADVTGVGTARTGIGGCGYAGDKGAFAYGYVATYSSLKNLVSNVGVVAANVTGVGTARYGLAATIYGLDKGIFGYGVASTGNVSITNKLGNTGVIAADTTGVGTAREGPAAARYGADKALFGYGVSGGAVSMTNLVSNAGVVATDTTGVGTARYYLAAAAYGGDKAIFGYGSSGSDVSMTNKVSNTGVVETDTTGVGTARDELASTSYGGDKAIFGYGHISTHSALTNLVSNAGVVSGDVTGVGTARRGLAAASFSLT